MTGGAGAGRLVGDGIDLKDGSSMKPCGYYGQYVGGLSNHSASANPASLRLSDDGVDLVIFRGLDAEREQFGWDAIQAIDIADHATVTSTRFRSARFGRLRPSALIERKRLSRSNTTVTLRLRSGERARFEFQHIDPAQIDAAARAAHAVDVGARAA
jgi:hypothetical protein